MCEEECNAIAPPSGCDIDNSACTIGSATSNCIGFNYDSSTRKCYLMKAKTTCNYYAGNPTRMCSGTVCNPALGAVSDTTTWCYRKGTRSWSQYGSLYG